MMMLRMWLLCVALLAGAVCAGTTGQQGTTDGSNIVNLSDSALSSNVPLKNTANTFTGACVFPTLQAAKVNARTTLTLTPSATAGDHTADGTYISFKVGSTAGMTATTTVVVVAGFTHADYNGTFRVYDVVDSTHFRVSKVTAEACSVVGTITHAPRVEDSGGVAHWSQDAAPTGPVTNDTWYETDTNIEWFWNGTYWLSKQEYVAASAGAPPTATYFLLDTGNLASPFIGVASTSGYQVYITRMSGHNYESVGGHDADNHVNAKPTAMTINAGLWVHTALGSNTWSSQGLVANWNAMPDVAVNAICPANTVAFGFNVTVTGTPAGNNYWSPNVSYRLVHP